MKKIMKLFVYVAAAAMTLASCQKNEIDNQVPQEYEYTFLIGNADTKAVIGNESVVWESGDKLGTFTTVANQSDDNTQEPSVNRYSPVKSLDPVIFSVYAVGGLQGGDKLYFYYPYDSAAGTDVTKVKMSIPTEQDGKDEMPMASLPFTVTDASADNNTDYAGEIKFANLGAVIEFYVYSTNTDYLSEKVQSVTYDAGAALAGNFEFDLTSVNYADQNTLKISGYEATSVVSSLAEPVVVGTSKEKAAKVKMVVAPGSYAGTITVKTDKATYTYNIATPKEYTRSSLRPLGADLAKGTRTAATTEEYTIQWDSASDWTDDMTLYSGYYTVKAVKNNGSTTPTINSTKNDCRVYAKGSVIVTHSAANIKKLVFNISDQGKKRLTDITASVGTVTIDTENWKVIWEGDASSVTFTVGDKAKYGTDGENEAGQLCFTSINAVAETTDAPIVAVLKKITLSGMTTEYELNDEFSFDGTVTASYFNGEDKTVEPTEVSILDMTTAGTKEVTVKYTEAGVTCEAKYSINVTDPNAGGNEGGETTEVWTLVTDASTLAVGDKIVIAAATEAYALAAQNNNNRASVAITKSSDKNTIEINDDVQIITLKDGKKASTFAFYTDEGYLYAASGSSNHLKTKTTLDDNGSWNVTISNGVATIKAQGTYGRNWLRFNSSNSPKIFSCYGSGQNDVSIYRLEGANEGGSETPVISVTSETIEVPAAGGNINIEWSVAPSVEDVYLEATEDVDWISPVTRSTVSGNLQYTVEENSGEARTATITLAYTGAESKTVTVKQAAPIKTQTIAEVLSLDKDSSVKTEGIVVAKYERGILISDDTGVILVYNGSSVAPVVGDKVSVSGKKGEYYGWAQIASPITIEVVSSENEVTYPNVTELDGTGMDNLLSATSVSYIQYTGTLTISGTYYNVGVEGATTAIGSIQYPVASLGLSDMHGKKIKVTGYHVGISSNKYVNTMATSVEVVETEEEPETPAPVINILTASPIEVAANGGNGTFSYAIGNPTTATITATDNAEWLTLGVPTSTSVSYTVIENTGAERIATITLAYEGAESKTVTVKQAAAEQVGGDEPDQPAEPVEYTLKFGSSYNSKSVQSYTDTWYSTTNGFKCTLVNWNNNQNGWSYVKAGRKNTASVATITTTNVVEAALETVTMTVDAVTTSKINSLKLYVSTDPNFSSKVEYTATAAKGDVVFNITDPIPNAYYKIEVNCASGSSNGLITVSKIVYKN